jgi:hypothetical protein
MALVSSGMRQTRDLRSGTYVRTTSGWAMIVTVMQHQHMVALVLRFPDGAMSVTAPVPDSVQVETAEEVMD